MKTTMLTAAMLGILGTGVTSSVLAANKQVHLCVGEFDKTVDSTVIPMWGYALAETTAAGDFTACSQPYSSPGPVIRIEDQFDGLTVTLHNTMTRPTSLVIPGTVKAMSPVYLYPNNNTPADTSDDPPRRVLSFDAVAAAGGSAVYEWNNLQPGSYLYYSGTHPQLQVQMGLYGAIIDDEQNGSAYAGIDYSHDLVLFYSEIDKSIHDSASSYDVNLGAAVAGGYEVSSLPQSTINYDPEHFLIDVDPGSSGQITYDAEGEPTITLAAGVDNPLVRFFNAGQRTHVPAAFAGSFEVIAEDAKPYPNAEIPGARRQQYTVSLPPLKSRDALLKLPVSPAGATVRLSDGTMALGNPEQSIGVAVAASSASEGSANGMRIKLVVLPDPGYVPPTSSAGAPSAEHDRMSVLEGGSINNILALAMSNDANTANAVASVLAYPSHGELIDTGNGFEYLHDAGEHPRDSIVYQLTNDAGESSTAGIIIDVAPQNDPPVANDDSVEARVGQELEIRVLANDSDPDSPRLRVTDVDTSTLGELTALEQVIIFKPDTEGQEAVTYYIADSSGATASAQLSLLVNPAGSDGGVYDGGSGGDGGGGDSSGGTIPFAKEDHYEVAVGSTLDITGNPIIGVMANDSPGAQVDTTLIAYPEHGAIQMMPDGTFIYTHDGTGEIQDEFVYEIYNEYGTDRAEVEIKLIPKAILPRVRGDRVSTRMGVPVLIDVLKNDSDKDSALDPNGIEIVEAPQLGTVEITNGKLNYTPADGQKGKDVFKYRLRDSVSGEMSEREAKVIVRIK